VLFFVHGYNVGFEDAARLVYDLNFEGAPLRGP
jgi:esterase/lipase superfamily enzyme